MNRKQRRAQEKINKKSNSQVSSPANNTGSTLDIDTVISDMNKVLSYAKSVDLKFTLMMDTLTRIGVCSYKDVKDTEDLYRQRESLRDKRIKELLAEDHTTEEYLDLIKEDVHTPGYARLKIHPVKDLNLNPFEIAQIIKDQHPDKSPEYHIALGSSLYNLNKTHFGLGGSDEDVK